jgi:hypothetical protein
MNNCRTSNSFFLQKDKQNLNILDTPKNHLLDNPIKSVDLENVAQVQILRRHQTKSKSMTLRQKVLNDEDGSLFSSVRSILKKQPPSIKQSDKKITGNICFVDKSPGRKKQLAEVISVKSYKVYNMENAFTSYIPHNSTEDDDDKPFSCKCVIM